MKNKDAGFIGLLALAVLPNLFMHFVDRNSIKTDDLIRVQAKLESTVDDVTTIKQEMKDSVKTISDSKIDIAKTRTELAEFKSQSQQNYDRLTSAINGLADKVEDNGRVLDQVQRESVRVAEVR